jgi:hypothetical protein
MTPADQPVIPGLEMFEVVYAKDQPQYNPLRALKSMKDNGAILTRWRPDEFERRAIADGADVFLEILTFHEPLQPVLLFAARHLHTEAWGAAYGLSMDKLDRASADAQRDESDSAGA